MGPAKYSLFGRLAVQPSCSRPLEVTDRLLFIIVKGNYSIVSSYRGMSLKKSNKILLNVLLKFSRLCSGFAWDHDGDLLGIITSSSSQVTLWDSNTQEKHIVDTGLRDPLTCIIWSKIGQMMAVGTARGNLAIYNHQTTK